MSPPELGPSATVKALWRYPVKSMRGEAEASLHVGWRGVERDRAYGVLDENSGTVISAKREGRLLHAAASLRSGELSVRLPDGEEFEPGARLNERLSTWLERPVRLIEAVNHGAATYESQEDFERDESPSLTWEGRDGSFVDESSLHLLTTGDLAMLERERPDLQWDVGRFRPNVIIESDATSLAMATPGRRFRLGDVDIEIESGCSRCVMTTRSQPGNLDRQLDVLRHVAKVHDGELGVRAKVHRVGVIGVGDSVTELE